MPDQQIDKPQAAVLVENAHGLWIRAKIYALAHEQLRQRKEFWFTQLARATLLASFITVILSAFGFSQEHGTAELSSPVTEAVTNTPGETPNSNRSQSNRVIWFFTALAAVLATLAKLAEQHIGRPEDIQAHSRAESVLETNMDSLKVLGVNLLSYYDGTQPHDLQDLSNELKVLDLAVNENGRAVSVTLDRATWGSKAQDEIKNNRLDIALSRVRTPEEIPDDAGDIQLAVRGGAA